MFFTINSIEGFIINLDGFLSINGKKLQISDFNQKTIHENKENTSFTQKLIRILEILENKPVAIVSSYNKSDIIHIISNSSISKSNYPLSTSACIFDAVIIDSIKQLKQSPEKCVYICADSHHLQSAHEVSLGTILFKDRNSSPEEEMEDYKQFPDFILDKSSDLLDVLSGKIRGYGGEVISVPRNFIVTPIQEKWFVKYFEVPNIENPDVPIYALGRCYSKTDPRHKRHGLSIRIYKSKNTPKSQTKHFATIFLNGINWIAKEPVDLITRIPPRPKQEDRFGTYLKCMKKLINAKFAKSRNAIICTTALTCKKDYPSLHYGLKDSQRRVAVQDVFEASDEVRGKSVVVIEDVTTTGATMYETISTLLNAGARKVIPLALAYHPMNITLSGTKDVNIPFEGGDGTAIPRCSNTEFDELGRGIFFGSSDYHNTKTKTIMDFTETVRKLNKAIGESVMAPQLTIDEDIIF